MPNFDDPQNPIEIQLTYDLLRRFVRNGLRLTFDEPQPGADHGEMNIIILRGAKPVSGFRGNPPRNRQEVQDQLNWASQQNDQPIIRLANNIHDQYNDVTIWAWQDTDMVPHVRAFLGSADPGEGAFADLRAGGRQQLVGYIGAGEHKATWGWHYSESTDTYYECLDIYSEDLGFDPNTGAPQVWGFRRRDPNDPNSQVQWGVITWVQLHAGGSPPRPVGGWSTACILLSGSFIDLQNRVLGLGNLYEELMGRYDYTYNRRTDTHAFVHTRAGLIERIEGPAHTTPGDDIDPDTGYRFDDQNRNLNRNRRYAANESVEINVIVWDAYALSLFRDRLEFGGAFNPVIPMGAYDPPGQRFIGWVRTMQRSLNAIIDNHILLPENWNSITSILPDAPRPHFINADGKFGPSTLRQLRTCQQICADLLDRGFLRVDEDVDINELRLECDQWLCGPETWKLLETDKFQVSIVE